MAADELPHAPVHLGEQVARGGIERVVQVEDPGVHMVQRIGGGGGGCGHAWQAMVPPAAGQAPSSVPCRLYRRLTAPPILSGTGIWLRGSRGSLEMGSRSWWERGVW